MEEEEPEEGDDDIVIVSKLNLNLPPIQYSKQYYDLNINGFESELKKLTTSATSLLPTPSLLSVSSNTVTTVTKSPLKSSASATNVKDMPSSSSSLNPRRLRANKQRYVHHIVTSHVIFFYILFFLNHIY
jgi:hypothetical protein